MLQNKQYLKCAIETLGCPNDKIINYQVRYKFKKNTSKLRFFLIKIKFENYKFQYKIS
ncbi:MAG: hypothetical protein ACRCW9_01850 [Cetobacterium sp.]